MPGKPSRPVAQRHHASRERLKAAWWRPRYAHGIVAAIRRFHARTGNAPTLVELAHEYGLPHSHKRPAQWISGRARCAFGMIPQSVALDRLYATASVLRPRRRSDAR